MMTVLIMMMTVFDYDDDSSGYNDDSFDYDDDSFDYDDDSSDYDDDSFIRYNFFGINCLLQISVFFNIIKESDFY
jgi:hypothetical protein